MSNPIASSSTLLRSIVHIVLMTFILAILEPLPVYAQGFSGVRLPSVGVRVSLSPEFNPAILKGVKVHADNPLRFDFILDKGEGALSQEELKEESSRLIKYFLAAVTLPDKDLWVNLSPYEKNRIIPDSFGLTEMGRDLLAQDYILKQITASLIYPEDEIGKKFWKRVYEEAAKKYKTTSIPVNTFNKVWIVPEKAVVYENAQAETAYVVESKLKVMLEQDYLAIQKNQGQTNHGKGGASAQSHSTDTLASQIVREIVLPELEKEVNTAKNFVQLRQVYHSLILATWYKKKIKDSILARVYADQNKITGLQPSQAVPSNADIQTIYQQYLQAFKRGVYNYIKEEVDPLTQETIPRKYFSGGVDFMMGSEQRTNLGLPAQAIDFTSDETMVSQADFNNDKAVQVTADMAMTQDADDATTTIEPNMLSMTNPDGKAYFLDTVSYSDQSAKRLKAGQGLAIPLELLSKLGSIKLWLAARRDADGNENIIEISKELGNAVSINAQRRRNGLLLAESDSNVSLTIPSNTGSLKARLGRNSISTDGITQITAFEDDDYVSRQHLEIMIEKGWLVLKNISSRNDCYLPTEIFAQILDQLSELPSLEGVRYGIDNLGDRSQEVKKGNIKTIILNGQEFFFRVGKTIVAVKNDEQGFLYAVRIDPKNPQRVLSRPVPLTIHHISEESVLEVGKTPNGGFFMMNTGVSNAWVDDQVQLNHVKLSVSASRRILKVDTSDNFGRVSGDVSIKIGSYAPGDLGEDLALDADIVDGRSAQLRRANLLEAMRVKYSQKLWDLLPMDKQWYKDAHPGKYHGQEHSVETGYAEALFSWGRMQKGILSLEDVLFLWQVALLHDFEPRASNTMAHVPATLDNLEKDWNKTRSLSGQTGYSVLQAEFGWSELQYWMARAIIQRSEFPFGTSHGNPFYKNNQTSPLQEYDKILRKINELDPSGQSVTFTIREAYLFSEIIDKANGYMRKEFEGEQGAKQMVVDLSEEFFNEGVKVSKEVLLKGSYAFLSAIGQAQSYEIDDQLRSDLQAQGMRIEPFDFLSRNQAFEFLPTDYVERFNENLEGFQRLADGMMEGKFQKGGIDLTADQMTLNIQNSGEGLQLNIDSAMLQKLQNASGLTPVIINIQPLNSLPMFLGFSQNTAQENMKV